MKKLFLLIAAIMPLMSALGQTGATNNTNFFKMGEIPRIDVAPKNQNHSKVKEGARATTVTIASEHFGSGTDTSLPTGWTAGVISGPGKWHWSHHASSSSNTMDTMKSTTASNGWMIFDADSFQFDCSCAPSGWLQSPAYNCTGHPTVRLNFENYAGQVYDTFEVWVSTDPTFATHTAYPVDLNNNLIFGTTSANTSLVHLNITSTAAGHAAVYIRYVFYGDDFFDLSWMIDDMTLTELEAHDAGIRDGYVWLPDANALDGSVFNTPLAFIDTFRPSVLLSIYASNAEVNVPTSATIFNGSTSVYSQTNSYTSLPVNAADSIVQYPGYKPVSTGSYECVFQNNLSTDVDHTNDIDTFRFNITDTTWMQNSLEVATNYYLNARTTGFTSSNMMGVIFNVPSGSIGDTVSGFGVAFSNLSANFNTTGKVAIQLYRTKKGDTSWTYMGKSVSRRLVVADYSTSTTTKWVDFRIDTGASGGVTPFVMQPGYTYAAVIQMSNLTSNLLVLASNSPNIPNNGGTLSIFDTSHNDGSTGIHRSVAHSFSNGYVPFIRTYFGYVPVAPVSVPETFVNNKPNPAYPDPANASINIPITMNQDGVAKVNISNITGQELNSQNINCKAGLTTNATFSTGDLADGVYLITIIANGQTQRGKFVVAH